MPDQRGISRLAALSLAVLSVPVLFCALSVEGADNTEEKVYGELKEDKALVYLIRKGRFQGSARTMFVYADEEFLGTLDSGTYTFAYVDPGTHLLWTNVTRLRREVDLVPNRVYYIEVWSAFNLLDPEEGKALVEKVDAYAIPKAREVQTADDQIRKRYRRALRREKEMEKAEVQVAQASSRPADTAGYVEVPAYTEIPLELMENVTSYLNPTGDAVWFRVASDVVLGEQRVVRAGTLVRATLRHSAQGKMGGVGGNFDMVVPTLPAADGSLVPLLGRIDATGKRRTAAAAAVATGTAVVTGLATGGLLAIAVAFPRGKEAFLLVGEEFTVWTRDNHWVDAAREHAAATEAGVLPVPEHRLAARPAEDVVFVPKKRRAPPDLQVFLESPEEVRSASIQQVGDWPLPAPLKASTIVSRDGTWVAIFPGWDVVRYARLTGEDTTVPLRVVGTLADGSSFQAEPTMTIVVKGTD